MLSKHWRIFVCVAKPSRSYCRDQRREIDDGLSAEEVRQTSFGCGLRAFLKIVGFAQPGLLATFRTQLITVIARPRR
jgi:hypothetical protein